MGVLELGGLVALMLTAALRPEARDVVVAPPADRLYGRVVTTDGDRYEGFVRWDRNEAARTDFLDAEKEIPFEFIREAESLDPEFAATQRRARSIVAFGMRLTWDVDDESGGPVSTSTIRFGHIASLVVSGRREARLELKSGGEPVMLHATSTDLGPSMRSLIVEDRDEGEVTIRWRELDRVDFLEPPAGARPASSRLYGTVTTWDDGDLTGYIAWDLDEALTSDILDGSEGREDYEIPFQEIVAIEWESRRSSRVVLRSGEELVLRGTNDVNHENRGIEVSDAGFGRATVPWDSFRSIRFHEAPETGTWPTYDAGAELEGIVYALDGRIIEGRIRWDNDESFAWEVLDGWYGDVDLDIEFGAIAALDKVAPDRVRVELHDGRTFELTDSNDVDESNRGIFVKPEGRARRLVRWRDLDRVVFAR